MIANDYKKRGLSDVRSKAERLASQLYDFSEGSPRALTDSQLTDEVLQMMLLVCESSPTGKAASLSISCIQRLISSLCLRVSDIGLVTSLLKRLQLEDEHKMKTVQTVMLLLVAAYEDGVVDPPVFHELLLIVVKGLASSAETPTASASAAGLRQLATFLVKSVRKSSGDWDQLINPPLSLSETPTVTPVPAYLTPPVFRSYFIFLQEASLAAWGAGNLLPNISKELAFEVCAVLLVDGRPHCRLLVRRCLIPAALQTLTPDSLSSLQIRGLRVLALCLPWLSEEEISRYIIPPLLILGETNDRKLGALEFLAHGGLSARTEVLELLLRVGNGDAETPLDRKSVRPAARSILDSETEEEEATTKPADDQVVVAATACAQSAVNHVIQHPELIKDHKIVEGVMRFFCELTFTPPIVRTVDSLFAACLTEPNSADKILLGVVFEKGNLTSDISRMKLYITLLHRGLQTILLDWPRYMEICEILDLRQINAAADQVRIFTMAMDSLFAAVESIDGVGVLGRALLEISNPLTVWRVTRLAQLLVTEVGKDWMVNRSDDFKLLEREFTDSLRKCHYHVPTLVSAVLDSVRAIVIAASGDSQKIAISMFSAIPECEQVPDILRDILYEGVCTNSAINSMIEVIEKFPISPPFLSSNLRFLEAIVDDIQINWDVNLQIFGLLKKIALGQFLNSAIRAVGIVWRFAECFDVPVSIVLNWFGDLIIAKDQPSVAEVRDCALKTAFAFVSGLKLDTEMSEFLITMVEQIIDTVPETLINVGNSKSPNVLVHHSRDSPSKQWLITQTVAIEGLCWVIGNLEISSSELNQKFINLLSKTLNGSAKPLTSAAARGLVFALRSNLEISKLLWDLVSQLERDPGKVVFSEICNACSEQSDLFLDERIVVELALKILVNDSNEFLLVEAGSECSMLISVQSRSDDSSGVINQIGTLPLGPESSITLLKNLLSRGGSLQAKALVSTLIDRACHPSSLELLLKLLSDFSHDGSLLTQQALVYVGSLVTDTDWTKVWESGFADIFHSEEISRFSGSIKIAGLRVAAGRGEQEAVRALEKIAFGNSTALQGLAIESLLELRLGVEISRFPLVWVRRRINVPSRPPTPPPPPPLSDTDELTDFLLKGIRGEASRHSDIMSRVFFSAGLCPTIELSHFSGILLSEISSRLRVLQPGIERDELITVIGAIGFFLQKKHL